MWFIGVEVEQETSAPPPKKNPGSAPAMQNTHDLLLGTLSIGIPGVLTIWQKISEIPNGR